MNKVSQRWHLAGGLWLDSWRHFGASLPGPPSSSSGSCFLRHPAQPHSQPPMQVPPCQALSLHHLAVAFCCFVQVACGLRCANHTASTNVCPVRCLPVTCGLPGAATCSSAWSNLSQMLLNQLLLLPLPYVVRWPMAGMAAPCVQVPCCRTLPVHHLAVHQHGGVQRLAARPGLQDRAPVLAQRDVPLQRV